MKIAILIALSKKEAQKLLDETSVIETGQRSTLHEFLDRLEEMLEDDEEDPEFLI